MRLKQSTSAIGNYGLHEEWDSHPSSLGLRESGSSRYLCANRGEATEGDQRGGCDEAAGENFPGDGLLHDARNLVSAIGLYCDLLSMPGVLKPEHRKYPEELRLLGTRSQEMIEHLMHSLAAQQHSSIREAALPRLLDANHRASESIADSGRMLQTYSRGAPVSLRFIVERCSGLLSQVANGRRIEVTYGPAADAPVRIAEESVERILVNLVRNGSVALGEGNAAIRITVGSLPYGAGDAKPWPFQRVRLVVEDSGCGMEARQLEALLSGRGPVPRGNHGIGFRVVRELVSASNGELRIASAQGIGTRIQIEWPMAEMVAIGRGNAGMSRDRTADGDSRFIAGRPAAHTAVGAQLRNVALSEERHGAR
jgi:signal transduction histidine kinase